MSKNNKQDVEITRRQAYTYFMGNSAILVTKYGPGFMEMLRGTLENFKPEDIENTDLFINLYKSLESKGFLKDTYKYLLQDAKKRVKHKIYDIYNTNIRLKKNDYTSLISYKDNLLNEYRNLFYNNDKLISEIDTFINEEIKFLETYNPINGFYSIKIKEIYEDYLNYSETIHNNVRNTLTSKRLLYKELTNHKIYTIGDILDENKRNKMIVSWRKKLNKKGELLSNHTINSKISKLTTFIEYAKKKGYIESVDYDKIDLLHLPEHSKDVIISDKDYKIIMNKIKKETYFSLYIELLYVSGARPGEILTLKPKDFNFDNSRVTITQHKLRNTKSSKYIHTIDIPINTMKKVKKYINNNKIDDNIEIFMSGKTYQGKPIGLQHYGKKFQDIIRPLKFKYKYDLYTFRHTHATKLGENGFNAFDLIDRLGHSSINYVMRYVHPDGSKQKNKIDKIFS